MSKIVVIDDDRSVRLLVEKGLEKSDHVVASAEDGESGLTAIAELEPDVVLLDVMLRGESGLNVYKSIQEIDRKLPVIFITAEADSGTAIEAMQMGAYDYIGKPLNIPQLNELVDRAARTRTLMSVPVALSLNPEDDGQDAFIGRSPQMLEVFKKIGRVAKQQETVLIRGESGTGKELVARAIYHHSDRADQPFIEVNCAALPDALLESELFGHEKGAFTGAEGRRIGKFEQCDGGTILLDEVGDMAPMVQAKVLRLLQEQRFERVGGNETIQTDVRIIAATNRDLEEMVEAGEYRADLLYRLNGITINLPPLREREDDVKHLLQHFLSQATKELGHRDLEGLSPDALDLLLKYQWPGNIRELRSVVRQTVLNSSGTVIAPEFLPREIRGEASATAASNEISQESEMAAFVTRRLAANSTNLYAETLELMERYLLTRVLQETSGNQSRAAEILGITRGKIRDRITAFDIHFDKSVSIGESAE